LLSPLLSDGQRVEVFGHLQTRMDKLAARIFPQAEIAYFEHGHGDYLYFAEHPEPRARMHALFADRFKRYMDRRGIRAGTPVRMDPGQPFRTLADSQARQMLNAMDVQPVVTSKRFVLVLLEMVDMYNVSDRFWGAYIDHVLHALVDSSQYHFLLKPHPSASASSLRLTTERCKDRGLSFTLLNEPWQMSMAAEILFAHYADRTDHVFCLFSSACFYLSQLYRDDHIKYHYSTDFMDRWISRAPAMFMRHYEGLRPLIKEVFSERCEPY
jgi:hypothetical protein